MTLICKPDLASDPRFATNQRRLEHRKLLDDLIAAWTAGQDSTQAERLLDEADVPASRIYTIADCANDSHFLARGMIRTVTDPMFGQVLHPGAVPKFSGCESENGIGWAGPGIGDHNLEVFQEVAGLSDAEIERLKGVGVI
jgi:crotonobetainyl-CoA:carnitine CoA-transferase CaiB-like acyl-CoA transferase